MLQNRDGYQLLHFVPKCALYLIKSEERQHIHSNLTTESSGTSSDPLPLQSVEGTSSFQFILANQTETYMGGSALNAQLPIYELNVCQAASVILSLCLLLSSTYKQLR